jgi:hypothetical protein
MSAFALHQDFEPLGAVRPQRNPLVILQLRSTAPDHFLGEPDIQGVLAHGRSLTINRLDEALTAPDTTKARCLSH